MGKKAIDIHDKVTFGTIIREEREKRKLTQAQVAKMVGMGANYYSMVERGEGNISFEIMQNILKVLNIQMKITILGIQKG